MVNAGRHGLPNLSILYADLLGCKSHFLRKTGKFGELWYMIVMDFSQI